MKLTFETALVHLKQGKRIRRAYWPEEVYLVKTKVAYDEDPGIIEMWTNEDGEAEPMEDYPGAEPWFCSSDLLEEDWEVTE